MSRLLHRKVAIGALIALTVLSALVALPLVNAHFTSQAAASSGRWTIRGHLVPAVRGRHALAQSPDTAQALDLSISLSLRNQSGLTQLIAAQNNPRSGLYHQYLSPRMFQARFSPTQATVNQVTSWLRSQGLVVHSVAANHLLIDASGSVATVEAAFQTTLASYQVNGRTVYAPTTEPSVPDSLSGLIVSITGLDDVGVYTHAPIIQSQSRSSRPHAGSGPGGGYTPSELRTAYDMNSLISSADGTGQTVAIFELDGYLPSDVNSYLSNYGLGSAKYSNVLVDGATNTAGAGAIEVELDTEVVSAIAPGATQKIYIGPNSASGVNDTYNKIVMDDVAQVTSTSWGLCEYNSGTSELQALDNIFQQGAAQGQAFFAASGDAGAFDCGDTNLWVDSPASDPYVVGVGGTSLQTGSGGSYTSESVWSNPSDTSRGPEGAGGGGGLSAYFARPYYYQVGPGTNNVYSNGNRQVPDVSADADPNTGYSMYCTVTASGCSTATPWIEVGGTSAAAPLWAGVAADLNQYLGANSKPALGSASVALYGLFNTAQTYTAYHDVTSGNNLYYPATVGYDQASGIGTPDVWNMARDLLAANRINDFSISAAPASISVPQNSSGTATIRTGVTTGSTGTVSLSASVSPSGPTMGFSPSSVTTGASSTLTVTASPLVNIGPYTVTITGTEGSAVHTTSVIVHVTAMPVGVTNGGFDSGNFTGWTRSGSTTISTTIHSGAYSAQVGSNSPYRGDSSISQTFTAPSGYGSLNFWYMVVCPDTVNFDWATATLLDNTTSSTTTILPHTCTNSGTWVQVSTPVIVGHVYTLTLISHDDNYPGDATYTLYDDVTFATTPTNPFANPDFELGALTGWTSKGVTAVSATAQNGSYSAQVGSTTPFAGDSSISQTVTIPSGATTLTFYYQVACHDTVAYDWATATLKDNTTNVTRTVLPHTCTDNSNWVSVTVSVVAGDSYTLTLIDHDDDWVGDPTYTYFDDITIS